MNAAWAVDTTVVARDTLVIAPSTSNTLLDWLSFVATLGVVGATGWYVYYTSRIYEETRAQTRNAANSAKAAQKANQIAKRSEFFPVFDLELLFSRPIPKTNVVIDLLKDRVMFDAEIFVVTFFRKDTFERKVEDGTLNNNIVYEEGRSLVGGFHLGTFSDKKEHTFTPKLIPKQVAILLQFIDALGNVYHRYQIFYVEMENVSIYEYNSLRTQSTEMNPGERYVPRVNEDRIFLAPAETEPGFGYLFGESPRPEYAEIQKNAPKPVKIFNRNCQDSVAGVLDNWQGLLPRRLRK